MPKLTVESVGQFEVPQGKRLVLGYRKMQESINCMLVEGMHAVRPVASSLSKASRTA